jgi:hypothetical protein
MPLPLFDVGRHFQAEAQANRHRLLARESITDYLRTALDLPDGIPGIVMTIQSWKHSGFNVHAGAPAKDWRPEAVGCSVRSYARSRKTTRL